MRFRNPIRVAPLVQPWLECTRVQMERESRDEGKTVDRPVNKQVT